MNTSKPTPRHELKKSTSPFEDVEEHGGVFTVRLAWYEVETCAHAGVRRRIESIRRGTKDAKGFNRTDKWDIDISGACGEMAVAKVLDKYWDVSVNTFHKGDVGKLQVRTSRQEKPYLVVQKHNDDDDIFVLVQGQEATFKVIGWMVGRDAKQRKFLRSFGGRPAVFAVPPKNLKPLSELR